MKDICRTKQGRAIRSILDATSEVIDNIALNDEQGYQLAAFAEAFFRQDKLIRKEMEE